MEENEKFERCNVYAQDIHRSNFAQPSRTNNPLHKTVDKVRCESGKLVIISGLNFYNHLFTETHLVRVAQQTPKRKTKCVASNKEFGETVY